MSRILYIGTSNSLFFTSSKFYTCKKSSSRKGDNGIVLVIGGSYIYHGAPVLSSLAALRCGTDLVYTSVPKSM
jgi:Predicted sugar kinase